MSNSIETTTLEGWLRQLLQIRVFEEHVIRLSRAGEVPGFVHVSSGQEAVAVGVCAVLTDGDYLFSGHRAHGHFLARGCDDYRLMAEILGRTDGLCGGYGGSMHLVDAGSGFLGATGVVGGNIPLAAGAAWAASEQGQNKIAVVFFGDGAGGSGVFHETLNLASLWRLPLFFVCENNGYAEFTSREEHSNVRQLHRFAAPYEIRSCLVDGNDVFAVHGAAQELVQEIREGAGPRFLECMTYRLSGHYVGDADEYRSEEDAAAWEGRDPIRRLQESLLERGVEPGVLDAIVSSVRQEMESTVQRARAAPMPYPTDPTTRVYAEHFLANHVSV